MDDTSKRPEKSAFILCALSALFCLLTAGLGVGWAKSFIIYAAIFPLVGACVFSLIAAWHAYLVRKQAAEKIERDRIKSDYERDDLFQDQQDALRMSEESLKQFEKWGVKIFTIIAGAVGLAVAITVALNLQKDMSVDELITRMSDQRNSVEAAGISFFFMIFAWFLGAYFNGTSREPGCRWLRPAAQWLILSAIVFFICLVTMGSELIVRKNPDMFSFDASSWDMKVGFWTFILMAFFSAELMISILIDFYRPRTKETESRPVYESRLLALITEPRGIAHNVAHSLDYQFGFKVSETWFYRFLEKTVLPFIILLALAFYLLTCFDLVKPHERAVKLHLGKFTGKIYGPGFKVKLPWPFQRFECYEVDRIKRIEIGFDDSDDHQPMSEEDPMAGDPTGRVIVWDKKHHKNEMKFLVATRQQGQENENNEGENVDNTKTQRKANVPVNFLSATISVNYKIHEDKLEAYAFNYKDSDAALRNLVQREVVRYFASIDAVEILGKKYAKAKVDLETRIKALVAEYAKDPSRDLGVEIVYVNLTGLHPPTEIAPAFQALVKAREQKRTRILHAEKESEVMANQATGEAYELIKEAEAYQNHKLVVAENEAARFEILLESYEKAPDVFVMRSKMDKLESLARETDIPIYAVLSNRQFKVIIDLVEKISTTLDDAEPQVNP